MCTSRFQGATRESAQLVKKSTDKVVHQVQLVLGAFEEAGFMDANRNDHGEIIGYKVFLHYRPPRARRAP